MRDDAQPEVIDVWPGEVPDSELWRDAGPELERPRWKGHRLVRNVSRPTLTVYLPEPGTATGTGVIVCPGGAFHFLMIDKEGADVARWLTARVAWPPSSSNTGSCRRQTMTRRSPPSPPTRRRTGRRWTGCGR
ncbi:MAG: hypothetical protein KatS3mg059_1456 [Thermomicrobiales bacterium]|nr:MAG: hypothetical protein KatS3mg059_1456 [Thermomicrobiales bacterium]